MITDFGLARAIDDSNLTHSDVVAGTPAYMSPEQAKGEPVQVQSDLFSLGSVIYAMCAGHPPFQANGSYATLRRIIEERHQPLGDLRPELPRWFIAIVNRLLQKSPSQRYDTAADLAKDLERALIYVRQPTQSQPPWPKKKPKERGFVFVLVAVVLLGIGAVLWNSPNDISYQRSKLERGISLENEFDQDLEKLESDLLLLNKELEI